MNIQIKPYENFDEAEIVELYSSVGWTVYAAAPDMLKRAYAGSMCVLGAYDGEKLVGIVRAVGDGASIMFIQDLLILPRYQRMGIGTRLMNALMEKYGNMYQTELMTDNEERTVAFYRSLGFKEAGEMGCCAFKKMQ